MIIKKLSKYSIKFYILMVGTVLLVLNEGFNDMAFLTNQVILEENGNDVIIASKTSDAIKGNESSVMSVSLTKAIEQDIDYSALIIVGGKELTDWTLLINTIEDFQGKNKIIGAIAEGIDVLENSSISPKFSESDEIVENDNIITVKNPSNIEKFVEIISNKI